MSRNIDKPLSGKRARLLILDDDELLLETISGLLAKLNIDSDTAVNVDEALSKYRSMKEAGRPYDAVILDLNIPGAPVGQEIIDRFREINKVTIIVTSGDRNDPIMEDYRKYGLAGRIIKPFKIDDLREVLNSVLRKPPD
jgi:DNA-binding response OmpR family regulator